MENKVVEMPKPQQLVDPITEQMKTGFVPPIGKFHSADEFPHLTPKPGEPWLNTIKMIHGMRKCQVSGTVMYLCSWEQDLIQNFYSPSWVLSQLITEKRHIADFFEFFAMKMELVQKD